MWLIWEDRTSDLETSQLCMLQINEPTELYVIQYASKRGRKCIITQSNRADKQKNTECRKFSIYLDPGLVQW